MAIDMDSIMPPTQPPNKHTPSEYIYTIIIINIIYTVLYMWRHCRHQCYCIVLYVLYRLWRYNTQNGQTIEMKP